MKNDMWTSVSLCIAILLSIDALACADTKSEVKQAIEAQLGKTNIKITEASTSMRAEGYVAVSDKENVYVVPDPCAEKPTIIRFSQPCTREKTDQTKKCDKVKGGSYTVEVVTQKNSLVE